jgi:YidC/Oxa1 family membrane protein insertase
LGLAVIIFSVLTRLLVFPLSLPAMRLQKKMQELRPKIKELTDKHKENKQALQQAQMELYKTHNINPLAGCLPQLLQIALLLLLYQVLVQFVQHDVLNGVTINPVFFWMDLRKHDPFFIMPILAGVSQFILSVMILPGGETPDLIQNDTKNKHLMVENQKEESTADMAETMQKQMLFMMPIMTGVAAANFPSGLGLYWVVTTVVSIAQQAMFSGWGGLTTYPARAWSALKQLRSK